MSDNQEYVKALTAGECPMWVVSQLADELDDRDATIKAAKEFIYWMHYRREKIFLGAIGYNLLDKALEALE